MSTAALAKPLTYEEERGKPMPSFNHGSIQANLIGEFLRHREYRVVSELSLEFDGQIYVPDISLYVRQPINFRRDETRRVDPPLLAVEILSPSQGLQEIVDKVEVYFRHGVKSCWIVSPPLRSITILAPDGTESVCHAGMATDPATGLTADLATIFS